MTISHARRLAVVLAIALAALIALPGMAFAATNPQVAATGGMTATLPILGGGVSVTVALDPAGNVSGVTVSDPSLTQTKSSTGVVKFATADGKTKVVVKALGSKVSISAKVTTLAELVGTGTWSANVFGNGVSSAQYTIGDDGSGNPTVSLTDPSPLASGVTWKAGTPMSHSGKQGGAPATAGGQFSYQGFTKTLKVSVSVEKPHGNEPGSASLKITLIGRDVQKLTGTLADLAAAGTRTWAGYLCDGTTKVTVSYHVNADGTIGFDGATGGTAVQKAGKNGGLSVRFTGTNVGFAARLKDNGDGTFTLMAAGHSGQCGKGGHGGHGGNHHHGGTPSAGAQQGAQTGGNGGNGGRHGGHGGGHGGHH
jgi:hypothetical protein